ncbi:MAG TPA: phosphoribosyltransferase family protein [Nitrososphaeraceae archaeon]|nr:phosphoribosyltransferase family protein [Nitrososphaeraceae archaeon]
MYIIFDKISSKFQLRLKDRANAANILGEALKDVIKKEQERIDSIALGIPRGGVIVGDIISRKLSCKFDIIIPRKLRAPHSEELAIGAVMEDGTTTYLNDMLVKELEVSQEYIEKEKTYQIQEIKRRSSLYYRHHDDDFAPREDHNVPNGKTVIILADDGAATGATVIAAARWIKKKTNNPKSHLIIAVPVVPKQTKELLRREADHVEVIISPSTSNFKSVGQYYQSFEPITDEQVIEIMKRN